MMYMIPLLLLPVLLVYIGRLQSYLQMRSETKKPIVETKQSAEVQRKVHDFLRANERRVVHKMMDYACFISMIYEVMIWAKTISVGVDTIPHFDVALSPWSLLWLNYCAALQLSRLQGSESGTLSVAMAAMGYNLVLVVNAVLIKMNNVSDRETMMLVVRVFAGFFFCDHRKAVAFQIIFVLLKVEWQPHNAAVDSVGYSEMWDVMIWHTFQQLVIVGAMWTIWFTIEYFVRTLAELMVQKSDTEASLQAARAVLASQCDAEAFLREDLTFQNPSAKMAHFFGMSVEDLKDKCFLDILSSADQERLQTVVTASVQRLQEENRPSAMSLTLSIKHGSGRQIEARAYLGSIAPSLDSEGICHLVALNEVRETGQEGDVTPDASPSVAPRVSIPESPTQAGAEGSPGAGGLPLNADTLAFHAWSYGPSGSGGSAPMGSINSVSVLFDSSSMEVLEISMSLNTQGVRNRKKTQLRECIIPGVWDEFRHWVDSAKSRRPSSPPAIVPFVFPKIVSAVVAARCSELKQAQSGDKQLLLTLRDIRLRRFQSGRSTMGKPMGRGTASHVSRE
eukprot:CAMPEP_0181409170 /NCGR_PEP_ID=MMETSP1110-20121109/6678_1 /TAXON_ID=174948 /ORGANISM="Symbiodinium sp., Strain CCMP421" /LENGTH=563 /DNA_ID=CAMNT_0023531663 /DNA_START=1 /DNA_END=1689 /DNA_ORIENTATION=-